MHAIQARVLANGELVFANALRAILSGITVPTDMVFDPDDLVVVYVLTKDLIVNSSQKFQHADVDGLGWSMFKVHDRRTMTSTSVRVRCENAYVRALGHGQAPVSCPPKIQATT